SPFSTWWRYSNTWKKRWAFVAWTWFHETAFIPSWREPSSEAPLMSIEKRWQARVEHILTAIERIQRYTAGITEVVFANDEKTIDAVIRNFQIIGEAARHVPN